MQPLDPQQPPSQNNLSTPLEPGSVSMPVQPLASIDPAAPVPPPVLNNREVQFGAPITPMSEPTAPSFVAPPAQPTVPPDDTPAHLMAHAPDGTETTAELDTDGPDDDMLLSWQNEPEQGTHRSSTWYIVMGVIAAVMIVLAIFLKSWFFIPLGILVPVALTMYSGKGTAAHSYALMTYGVTMDDKHYAYDDFNAFFEVDNAGKPVFEIVPTKRFGSLLTLHATPEIADDIVEILGSVLPETEPQGYLGESVFKRLKF